MSFLIVGKAIATRVPARLREFLALNGCSKATICSKSSLLSWRMAITLLAAGTTLLLNACSASLTPASLQASTNSATSQSSGSQAGNLSPAQLPEVQAYEADSFVDSIGVGLHMTYTYTNYYSNWPATLADLQSLGVRHVRDGFYNFPAGTPYVAEHQQLAAAGIKTDYVMPINDATTPALVASIAKQVGDMESVEGPNECDLPGDCNNTTEAQGVSNMLAFMPTVDAAGAAAGVPVVAAAFSQYPAFTQVGNLSSEMTYNNLHVYYNGRYPGNNGWYAVDAQGNSYWGLPFWLNMANEDAPGTPVIMTETGYMMVSNPQQNQIPESTGASYIPRTLLLTYLQGVNRTYLYELLDEPSSPGYGLIDGNMNPKPAFLALQNVIANLTDKGSSFTPGQLAYSLTGGDSTLKQILFQKRDGSFWLVMWLEQSSWDEVNLVQTPVAPQQVTLNLNSNYAVAKSGIIDSTGNMNWTNPAASPATLQISDAVTMVQILPSK